MVNGSIKNTRSKPVTNGSVHSTSLAGTISNKAFTDPRYKLFNCLTSFETGYVNLLPLFKQKFQVVLVLLFINGIGVVGSIVASKYHALKSRVCYD
jgi:hypothetical protein